jgi:hypothetical protein
MLGLKNDGMLLFMIASKVLRLNSCIFALIPGENFMMSKK